MKIQYLINDISDILLTFYLKYRQIEISDHIRNITRLHMKQSIMDTYKYMYDPVDDVYSIDIWDIPQRHVYILPFDIDFDHSIWDPILCDMRDRLISCIISKNQSTMEQHDDVINIHVVPFDEFGITLNDIISVFDLDCI